MTESELRRIVCTQAARWIGRCEGNGSHREIIDVYNTIVPLPRGYRMTYYDPWCAAFVSAVAQTLGLCAYIFPECGCGPMVANYQTAGRWMERDDYLPDLGDVIFYDWEDSGVGDNTGAPDHVGLVIAINGDAITVVEGNCGNAVRTRSIRRNGLNIRGYGLPDYAAAAAAEQVIIEDGPAADEDTNVPTTPEESVGADAPDGPEPGVPDPGTVTLPAPPEGWSYVPLPTLQIGDGGEGSPLEEAVRAAQLLLKGRGFSVGWYGCDGDFGRTTERAVGKYQLDRALERDGIIGPETWRKLICE